MKACAALAFLCVGLGALAGPVPVTAQGAGAQETTLRIRYRTADTVYLDAGRMVGLSVGDRLEVVRDDAAVALIEVIFLADHSASARAIEGGDAIRDGDLVRPLAALRPPPVAPASETKGEASASRDLVTAAPEGSAAAQPRRSRRPGVVGVLTLDHDRYSDERDEEVIGRDHEQTTARLSLRARDLGGLPLSLRARLRYRQVSREGDRGFGVPRREDRDRVYELALRWAAGGGRYQVDVGRLGAGPFTGIGDLDGVSGAYALRPGWQIGGFVGRRPELGELGLASNGSKYGVFSRWTAAARLPWEVFVAGVREEDDRGAERDVAIVETRIGLAGGRWSLAQRAEVDLGHGSSTSVDGETDDTLTQLALALTGRLGAHGRLVLSYDRYDPVLRFEDADQRPGQQIRDLLRQGWRASVRVHRGQAEVSISGGLREGEGDDDTTYSFGLGLRRARARGLALSADVVGFSNRFTDGQLATLRAGYAFGAGHHVSLNAGGTMYEADGDDRASGWLGLELWFELPASLYARGELEVLTGDDAEGERLRFGVGYRF